MTGNGLPPEFLYQARARETCAKLGKTGILAPPGSGKTRVALGALEDLSRVAPKDENRFPQGPILIVCSGPAISTWVRQIPLWLPPFNSVDVHIVRGSKEEREDLWQEAYVSGRGFYVTNYAVFRNDFVSLAQPHGVISRPVGEHWGAFLFDEYHKCMLHRTRSYKLARSLTAKNDIAIWITGSGLRKNPSSMWTLFNMIAPKVFTSYWSFVNSFCVVNDGYFGKEILGPKNIDAFKALMKQYLAVVPNEVVADQLPEGKRNIVSLEMTKEQRRLYDELVDDMIALTDDEGNFIWASNPLHLVIQLRKLLCCPKMLGDDLGWGAGLEYIWDQMDFETHALIFVPFRKACDLVQGFLNSKGYHDTYILRGGTKESDLQRMLDAVRATKGILICTIAYGESWDLETCDTTYFLGYDFVLDINEQAEGRTRRAISEHKFVTWNYIKYVDSIDESFLSELALDLRNYRRIMGHPKELIEALRGKVNQRQPLGPQG